jgi:hypothetical protein
MHCCLLLEYVLGDAVRCTIGSCFHEEVALAADCAGTSTTADGRAVVHVDHVSWRMWQFWVIMLVLRPQQSPAAGCAVVAWQWSSGRIVL